MNGLAANGVKDTVPTIPVIRIEFPFKHWDSVHNSLKRMPTGAKVFFKQLNPKTAQVKIVADSYDALLDSSTEVWRQLATKQKKIRSIVDAAMFEFVSSWTKDDLILFQNTHNTSIMWQNTGSILLIVLKSWTEVQLETAMGELRKMQSNGKYPTETIESTDFLQLRAATMKEDDLFHLPTDINVAILGPTGVGKSLFINNMANCLKFKKLSDMEKKGPQILIPTRFTFRQNGKRVEFQLKPEGHDHNERFEVGKSATQKPRVYTFAIPGKREHRIQIIDTPGVGDTDGLKKDHENFEEIMAFLANFPRIHAILILLKPTDNRLTDTFKYHMNEMLVRLHKTAAENIIFCYTHSQSVNYREGGILDALEPFLENMQRNDINIELERTSQYYFESDFFRYIAAGENDKDFYKKQKENKERELYKTGFKRSQEEFKRLFKYIMTLSAHDTNQTLCINNTKKVIRIISKPLAELTKTILENQAKVDDYKQKVEELKNNASDLEDCLHVEQKILTAKTLDTPQTVCTSPQCRTNFGYGVCDAACEEKSVEACKLMKDGVCTSCNCATNFHLHVKWMSEEFTMKIRDYKVDQELRNIEKDRYKLTYCIKDLNNTERDLIFQKETLRAVSIKFAVFYYHHSLVTVNDAYIAYLELVKKNNYDNKPLHKQLEEFQRIYEEEVRILKEAPREGRKVCSVQEINELIEQLKVSDWCGQYLQDILYMEVNSVQSQELEKAKKVFLSEWRDTLQFLLEKPVGKMKKFLEVLH